jgi:hypothetical protein
LVTNGRGWSLNRTQHPPSAMRHPLLPGSARNTVLGAQMQRAFCFNATNKGQMENAGGKPSPSLCAKVEPQERQGFALMIALPQKKTRGRQRAANQSQREASQAVNKRSTIVVSVSWLANERCAQGFSGRDPPAATVGAAEEHPSLRALPPSRSGSTAPAR